MLDPRYLADLPDLIVKLYMDVADDILADMARRISKYDYWIPSAEWQNQMLKESGALQRDVIKKLSDLTGKSEKKLRKLMRQAARDSIIADSTIYNVVGKTVPAIDKSASLLAILNAGYKATNKTMRNLTRTTARTATQQFENALDRAWLQIRSGAFSPDAAIHSAIKELSSKGIGSIKYPTGHTDNLEVAVRRAVVTGVNQTCGQISLVLAKELGCELMEITAHAGARPEHAEWQGKIVCITGRKKGYLTLSDIGYGTGGGFKGWNCRHDWSPYFDGMPRTWTDEKLRALNAPRYTYNGKSLNEYEASQQQRYLERQVRKWKREYIGASAAGLDTGESAAKLKYWRDREKDFLAQTGLKRQTAREFVPGFDRSSAAKAAKNDFAKSCESGIIKTDKQFGKKVGKHAADWGLDSSNSRDRAKMESIIDDIYYNHDSPVRIGGWRGQTDEVLFYIKGEDVVITKQTGQFVTILKGGTTNARVKNARER